MKRIKFLCSVLAAIVLLGAILTIYNRVITPKYLYGDGFPTSQTYLDFYELEKNSVDVLFLGSSHAVCAFVPPELYASYGLTSYNLGCEQQNLITSYFWLEEALKTQSPSVVVCDCGMLYLFDNEALQPSLEGCTRKALDYMRWSTTKLRAVRAVSELGETLSPESFLFPALRYHDRWKELTETDFKLWELGGDSLWKGYYLLTENANLTEYVPLDLSDERVGFETEGDTVFFFDASDGAASAVNEWMLSYLDRIAALCEERNIPLILTATPTSLETKEAALFLQKYANQKGLLLVDFNEYSVYEATGYCFATDNHDDDHANISGAVKITDYLGEVITGDFAITSHSGDTAKWEDYTTEYKEQNYMDNRIILLTGNCRPKERRAQSDTRSYRSRGPW